MKSCGTCRYWSDLIARQVPSRSLQALCLRDRSPNRGSFTTRRTRCGAWTPGQPIDAPTGEGKAA